MSKTIALRAATPSDAADIARVHIETWRNTYAGLVPDEFLLRMTEVGQTVQWAGVMHRTRRADTVLVAEAAGPDGPQVVGFGNCGRARTGPIRGEVFTLYISSDWQNRGIGRRLLTGLFEALASRKIGDAVIWVLSGNQARFFYEAMGGTRLAERKERFAGATLQETAYIWPDLQDWLAKRGGRA